jgi:pyruvate dehydrogenase E2 component (dihydrolipoamide acetyltransferase)
MAIEVIIPALGLIVEKVKILNWLKSEGDRVEKGEPLLEIESDKVVTEILSPASGILGSILYGVGVEVPITTVVGLIMVEGEEIPEFYRQQVEELLPTKVAMAIPLSPLAEKRSKPVKVAPAAQKLAEERKIDLSVVIPTGPHGTIMKKDVETYLASGVSEKRPQKVSGLALKVAEEFRVSLARIEGTGVQGRIMKADVLRTMGQKASVSKEESLFGKIIPMSKMRQVIVRRLSESAFTAPHIYLFIDVDMEEVLRLRGSIMKEFEEQFEVGLSINDFLIKAVALAIREYPLLNASVKGNEIHIHPEINIGLAVALDEGLIVPAIPRADKLSLRAIAQMRVELVSRGRKGKLTLNEIERGTFTISSLANFGIRFFTAIINPPQSGILSVGKIEDQLYLENGEVKGRKISRFGLSADHRIVDGVEAAKFLQTTRKIMENPNAYFVNVLG